MLNFAGGLSQAAAARNWDALAQADGQLAVALPRLAAQGPWSAGERAALEQLWRAHRDAYGQCVCELGAVQERIDELRASHAGWRAYAENGDIEESRV